jgi:hypothetical protein
MASPPAVGHRLERIGACGIGVSGECESVTGMGTLLSGMEAWAWNAPGV